MVFRHGPDVGLMSIPMSSLSDIGLMSARYRFRHLADIELLWFSADIDRTSSLYRPDVGQMSLTTSGRHRAHVQIWSRPDISRRLPISARYNFRHPADVVADISDIGPTSGRSFCAIWDGDGNCDDVDNTCQNKTAN